MNEIEYSFAEELSERLFLDSKRYDSTIREDEE